MIGGQTPARLSMERRIPATALSTTGLIGRLQSGQRSSRKSKEAKAKELRPAARKRASVEIWSRGLKTEGEAGTVTNLGLPRAARVGFPACWSRPKGPARGRAGCGSVTDRGSLFYNLKLGGGGLPNTQSPTAPPAHLAAGFARAD